jgi:hypothetical protein
LAQKETPIDENNKSEKKISYTFINEYGLFLGGTYGFAGVFINGISIHKTDFVGIGMGYETDLRYQQGIPIFLNFRHYFGQKKLKPLVNFAIGTRISFWVEDYNGWYIFGTPMGNISGKNMRIYPGLYATMAGGFKLKTFSLSAGLFMKSWKDKYFGGVEVKVGYTF